MTLLLLSWEFFKTGLFAIGGGMATIPFLTKMAEVHPEWFTLSMLADMIAVSEATPGPIGVNMATYVGYKVAGIPGALLATFSLTLPSFLIILVVARMLERFRSNRYVDRTFSGLRPTVTGLIAAACFSVFQVAVLSQNTLDIKAIVLFIVVLASSQWKALKKLHPLAYIAICAVCGILFF